MRFILSFSVFLICTVLVSCKQETPEPAAEVTVLEKPASDERAEIKPKVTANKSEPPELLLTREEIEVGWIQLFDGESLFGWKAGSNANWSVQDGVIVADSGDVGLLATTTPFVDYELRCDFRLAKGTNSGIFLRTVIDPKDPTSDCYELNLCDDNPFPTGSFVGRKKIETAPKNGRRMDNVPCPCRRSTFCCDNGRECHYRLHR